MQRLIALTGPAGAGKSFAASVLVDEFGFHRMKFAATGKDMVRTMLGHAGVPAHERDRYIEGDLKETPTGIFGDKSPRYVMQTLCTEWGREHLGPDIWVNITMAGVLQRLADGNSVVLDDCRFDNEAFEVKKLGGIVAQIRPTWQAASPAEVSHPSERGLRKGLTTHLIPNCGEPAGFRRELVEVLGL